MSGIDKLIFKIPHTTTQTDRIGYSIRTIIDSAERYGYQQCPNWLDDRKPGIAFMSPDTGRKIEGCTISYYGSMNQAIATQLVLNPNKFERAADLWRLLDIIGEEWICQCTATRIDAAADYGIPYPTILQSLDVADRSNSEVWFDARAGLPRTVYFGAGKDKILIYDKAHEQRRRRHINGISFVQTRIERQLREKHLIDHHFGYSVTPTNMFSAFRAIARGEITFFNAVTLHHFGWRSEREAYAGDLQRQMMFEGLMQISSYANARRYVNAAYNDNFIRDWRRMMDTRPFPEEEQPDAILQYGMRQYMARRLPPVPLAA